MSTPSSRRDLSTPRALALAAAPMLLSVAAAMPGDPASRLREAPAEELGDELLFDEPGDGALWVRGASYKARFGVEGATVVPFFGSDAPRNYPVELNVSAASIGSTELDAVPERVARDGDTVRIERAGFVEEYVLTTQSLEQRFVFEELPADRAGDLVVRMDVATELAGSDLGLALRFENELGRVDYGEAFAIDADGRRIGLDSTLVDGELELRVPADFVAQAQLPLVIDPLVTMATIGNTSSHDQFSDVSYDVTTDRWCVVFTLVWSQSDHDAYARLATGAYAIQPGYITLDFTSDSWTTPKVANNNRFDVFLAVCAVVPAGSGVSDIRGRIVDPATSTAGNAIQITPANGPYRNWPDVGGDPYEGGPGNFCVVWQRSKSPTDVDIEALLVSHQGILASAMLPLDDSPEKHVLPTISSSCGNEIGVNDRRWTAVWQKEVSSADHDVYAAQVHTNGSILVPRFAVAFTTHDETNPVVSPILDPETPGLARLCVVAFERDYGHHDVVAAVVATNAVVQEKNLIDDYPQPMHADEQLAPAIDSDGRRFLIGFDDHALGSSDHDVWARLYYWTGSDLAAFETPQSLGGSPTNESDLALHSMATSGGTGHDYLATYSYLSFNAGFDVIGALYRGPDSLVSSSCHGSGGSCPCANTGDAGHGCANSAHPEGGLLEHAGGASLASDTFSLTATYLPANRSALLFQGSDLGYLLPFGSGFRCAAGTTLRLGLQTTDAAGSVTYPGPGGAALSVAGSIVFPTTLHYQVWYRDPVLSGCATTFNLTNALSVTWEP